MKTFKSIARPNVLPAKWFSVGDKVQEMRDCNLYRKDFRATRRLIQDLCDFCLEPYYFKRFAIVKMRVKGYKTCCTKCYKEKFGTGKIDWDIVKREKLIIDNLHNIKN